VSLINTASDKQETINRMINKQYDQLLKMCEKSTSELEYIKQHLLNDDSEQQSEIERTEALINSIIQDVNVKKQEMQNLALKNRYDQLMSLYQKTQDEVQMLEATLEKELPPLGENQLEIFTQKQADVLDSDEPLSVEVEDAPTQMQSYFGRKNERLNLNAPSEPLIKEKQHEDIIDKWHESLAKVNEIEKEQLLEELIENLELPPVPIDPPDAVMMTDATLDFELPEAPTLAEAIMLTETEKVLLKQKPQKKKSKGFSWLKLLLNMMFYLVLISSIFFTFVFGIDNHNHTPGTVPSSFFGYSVMRVATGSMSPSLPVNTVIVARHVDPSELRLRDIVTFVTDDGRTITHRIYQIYENYQNNSYGFRLIGDANDGIADDVVHLADDLIGRVVYQSYPLGRALMFIHRYFLTIMAMLVFSLVLLLIVKMRIRFKKKSRRIKKPLALENSDLVYENWLEE